MFVEQNFVVGFRHIDKNFELLNRAILGYFEDAAGAHSSKVGYGLWDIPETHLTWFLISVKVKVIKRPIYGDRVTAVTWSRGRNRLYAYRDYELKNEAGEVMAVGTSNWIPIDVRTMSVMRLTDEITDRYETEEKCSFPDDKGGRLKEPKSYSLSTEFKIGASLMDFNNHVHNTRYLDLLPEILPKELQEKEPDEFELFYKNQVRYGETVKLLYGEEKGSHYVAVKSLDESELHALIRFEIN